MGAFQKRSHTTVYLVKLAVLTAILLLLEITGLGFFKLGVLELTIMQVPVIVGAIILGPSAGAVLGSAFGLLSFWECFGRSPFGAALLGIQPVFAFIVCFVPRLLMGWITGLIFRGLHRLDSKNRVSFYGASLCGALLNTLFFMSALILLFGKTDFIQTLQAGKPLLLFLVTMVGVQGLVEAVLCCISGAFIGRALFQATLQP